MSSSFAEDYLPKIPFEHNTLLDYYYTLLLLYLRTEIVKSFFKGAKIQLV